jgi:hypothetical protein
VSYGVCDTHRKRDRSKNKEPRVLSSHPSSVYSREWRKKNVLKAKDRDLKKAFGITVEQYQEMLEKQRGLCAICGEPDKRIHGATKKPIGLSVDHCHTTKKVRALLCSPCNQGIGNFKDDPQLLRAAAAYLEQN